MGEAFPELKKNGNAERVASIIEEEEASFHKTLDRGISLFEQAAVRASEEKFEELQDAAKRDTTRFGMAWATWISFAEDAFLSIYACVRHALRASRSTSRRSWPRSAGCTWTSRASRSSWRRPASGAGPAPPAAGAGRACSTSCSGSARPARAASSWGTTAAPSWPARRRPICVFRESEGSYRDTADQPAGEGDRVAVVTTARRSTPPPAVRSPTPA